ncbi:MAG: glycosyltransferase family 87 protein [Candidatus Omnitrophota bacterium]
MIKKYKILLISFLVVFSVAYFLNHKYRAPKKNYADFRCFYTAGKRMADGENIYVIRDQQAAEYRYAPVFALFMSALAAADIDTADSLWFIINYLLLVAVFILLKKMVFTERLQLKSSIIFIILVMLGIIRFIFPNFDNGQSNIMMMAAITTGLYLVSKKMEVAGGAILAFSAMIKYTPLIFIPYFFFRRKYRLASIIMASLLAYLILPAAFIGWRANFIYLGRLLPFLTQSTILEPGTILDPKNQSLLSALQRLFTYCISSYHAPHMPFESLNLSAGFVNFIFISSAILLYGTIFIKPRLDKNSTLYYNIDYALLLICVSLFNLNAWMQAYILLLMPYFVIVYYLIKCAFRDKLVSGLLLMSYILNIITIKGLFGEQFSYKAHFYSPYTLMGLILFLALLKIKFLSVMKKG